MGRVYWTIGALRDLESTAEYIARDAPIYAISFVERVLEHTEKLSEFSNIGRIVPEFGEKNLRELIFQNYRIVYRILESKVNIICFCHGSMDLANKAEREDWEVG